MAKIIRENTRREHGNGSYTVCVNAEGKTKIFINRDDEYIISERYSVLYRTNTLKEAETAEKHYIYRNTVFCVIAVNYNGELKLKLRKYSGVIYIAPIGTVGIFKRRRNAKKFMNKLRRENEEANECVEKTA